MLDPQFVSYTLKAMYSSLVALSLAISSAGAVAPVTSDQMTGYKSDMQMIYTQDMLGTGESYNGWDPINPLLVIKPVDPRGVVYPTSTEPVAEVQRVFVDVKPAFSICAEYPLGGAPANVKCGN